MTLSRLCGVAILLAGSLGLAQPLAAQSRKLTFEDLPGSLEQPFWAEVDLVAAEAALLHRCHHGDVDVEHRFRDAVEACIDARALDKTAEFYRAHYRDRVTGSSLKACTDPSITQDGLLDKIVAALDQRVSQAAALCQGYLKTGNYGHR